MSNEKSRESAEGARKIITRQREKGSGRNGRGEQKERRGREKSEESREGKPLADNYLQSLAKQTRKNEQ